MKHRIIIADDSATNRLGMKLALTGLNLEIIEAVNGKECIEKAKLFNPICIIMDLMMPVMDGIEAIKLLKSDPQTKYIHTIAITVLDDAQYKNKFYEVGSDDFLEKPVSNKILKEKVQAILS